MNQRKQSSLIENLQENIDLSLQMNEPEILSTYTNFKCIENERR